MEWRGIRYVVASVIALAVLTACDTVEAPGDSEAIIGSWRATNVKLNGADITAFVLPDTNIRVVFDEGGSFLLSIEQNDVDDSSEMPGYYIVDESAGALTVYPADSNEAESLHIEYRFEETNVLVLGFESDESLLDGFEGLLELAFVRE